MHILSSILKIKLIILSKRTHKVYEIQKNMVGTSALCISHNNVTLLSSLYLLLNNIYIPLLLYFLSLLFSYSLYTQIFSIL